MQRECINYNEVFSPVVKQSSIRILFALVAQYELELDVKTVFLHDDLDEEIFMTKHAGFKTAGKENMLCKLKKTTLWAKTIAKAVTQQARVYMK